MKNSNSYPFPTKAQIIARLLSSDEAVLEALGILYNRQTEDEQRRHDTKYKNRRGFMSSHAVNGCKLVEKVASGEALSDEDMGRARSIVVRYGRQLATVARDEAVRSNPDLASQAACFFTGSKPTTEILTEITEVADEDVVEES